MPENQVFRDAGWRITSPYGWRNDPHTGQRRFHRGVDMVRYHQYPIPTFTGGEVLHAGWGHTGTGFGNYGNVVALWENGHLHIYAHLDSVAVRRGNKINRGQIIGRQGNTGKSAGSHLHYEVRTKRAPLFGFQADVDPGRYLQARLKELEEPAMGKHFKDVPDNAWFANAVNCLYEAGLIGGYEDGTYKPNNPVTRAEIAVLLQRFAAYLGREV